MVKYRNPFYNKQVHGSKEFIETVELPTEYKGYFVFQSQKGSDKYDNVFDIVKNEVLINQRVSLKSCKSYIEELLTKLKTSK